MKSDGYLVPPSPSTAGGEQGTILIWEETWKRVDRFLPGMRREIFPDPTPQVQQQQPQQQQSQRGIPRTSAEDEGKKEGQEV